jgi:hypothetical protein
MLRTFRTSQLEKAKIAVADVGKEKVEQTNDEKKEGLKKWFAKPSLL